MQHIAKIKEILTDLGSVSKDFKYCLHPDDAEALRVKLSSAKTNLLKLYDKKASIRFDSLDPALHNLFKQNFSSLVLAVGALQEVHDSKVRAQHIDPNTFHNLLLQHIHPILTKIDHRLLAMHTTLTGFHVIARRNP
ncbi:hypothetical protein KY333_01465 [Candidatus Woesearchaeota archaeon]|nr:hypothetical protein [Candidatus Woesearchaeota archaeon]